MTIVFLLFLILFTALLFAHKYRNLSIVGVLSNVVFLVVWSLSLVTGLLLFLASKALRTDAFEGAQKLAVDLANESEHKIKTRSK